MKKCFALLFTMGIVLCTLATANAEELKVSVPFDFVVSGKTLPAATYVIRESLPNNDRALAVVGEGTGAFAIATDMNTGVKGTKLVFHRIGDQYFLSDVVNLSGTLHFAVSAREEQLARSRNQAPLTTSIGN
jgi:hypothetical protein